VQTRLATDLPRLAQFYKKEVLSKTKPCFHRWYAIPLPCICP
jgi:hypothetical protein